MARLEGRVALVTGAGRGFGRAIAVGLAEAGADIAVNYRASAEGAAEVARAVEGLGRRAWTVRADVSREDDVRAMVDDVLRQRGRIEEVAYCAVAFAADEAGYLTGQILHPSGGWVMG